MKQKIYRARKEDEDDEFIDNEDFIDSEGDPENEMLIDSENSGDEEPPEQIKKQPKKKKGISSYIRN